MSDPIEAAAKAIDPLAFQPAGSCNPRGYEGHTQAELSRVIAARRKHAIHVANKVIAAHRDAQDLPTHQHRKGGLYRELMRGQHERDLAPVVVYKSMNDGRIWVRYADEFDDGRFTPLAELPQTPEVKP